MGSPRRLAADCWFPTSSSLGRPVRLRPGSTGGERGGQLEYSGGVNSDHRLSWALTPNFDRSMISWRAPTHLRVRSARENAPVDALVAGTPCHGFELSAASTGAL